MLVLILSNIYMGNLLKHFRNKNKVFKPIFRRKFGQKLWKLPKNNSMRIFFPPLSVNPLNSKFVWVLLVILFASRKRQKNNIFQQMQPILDNARFWAWFKWKNQYLKNWAITFCIKIFIWIVADTFLYKTVPFWYD